MSDKKTPSEQSNNFIVVMRGPSAVLFRQETPIRVKGFPSAIGPVNIVYTTRWLQKGNGIVVPGHIWMEVSGSANNFEEALVAFANAGISILPILSLSANASIGEPEIEIAFDNTRGITERDYFQCYVAPERTDLHIGRHINIEATVAIINSLASHPENERLRRAANQYRLALEHWRLGRETLSLAHLWMALEAITKARIRVDCTSKGLVDQKELAENYGIELKKLDPYIRKEILLKGDEECYSKAKKASDGFEHGFLGYDKISQLSKGIRHKMAEYTRNAILELCNLDNEIFNVLTKDPFDKPIGYWPVVKYLRGKLVGANSELAAEGNAYPIMRWKPVIKKTERDEEGKYNISIQDLFTAELGAGISFQPVSYEAWQVV